MWHRNRTHSVRTVAHNPAGLGEMVMRLTEYDLCLCSGFKYGPLFLLNDSTSEDGLQEYAVWDERVGFQVESLTVSWMTKERLTEMIRNLDRGGEENRYREGSTRIDVEDAAVHAPCEFCA